MDITRDVESSDDILHDFFERLPLKSLVRLMTVSRRWKKLIVDPIFIMTYDSKKQRRCTTDKINLLGLIQCNTKFLTMQQTPNSWVPEHRFLVVGEEGNGGNFPLELGYFMFASNCLVLCGCLPATYHVVNPITKKCVSLPPPPLLNDFGFQLMSVGLFLCKPEEDREDYRVILAGSFTEAPLHNLVLYTYFSVSGEWMEDIVISNFKISILSNFELPPVFIKNDIHWFTKERDIVVYGYSLLFAKYNPQLVRVPLATEEMILWRTDNDNGQTLWLGTSSYDSLNIFSLPIEEYERQYVIDKDEWTLIYTVNMNFLIKNLIGISKEDDKTERGLIEACHHTRKLVNKLYLERRYVSLLSAHIMCDPPGLVLLVRYRENIYLYNLNRQTIDQIQLQGRHSFTDSKWKWYPHLGTLPTLSSYVRDKNFKSDQAAH